MHNLPTLFDETGLTADDRTYLAQKELRIKAILMQSTIEIGCEFIEVRQWFADNHKWGFEAWIKDRFGYTPEHAHTFMTIAKNLEANYSLLPGVSLNAQLQLAKAPDPQ